MRVLFSDLLSGKNVVASGVADGTSSVEKVTGWEINVPYFRTNGSYIIEIAKPVFNVSATNRNRTYKSR